MTTQTGRRTAALADRYRIKREDGGGSTTMVVAERTTQNALRVINRPSDPTGERTVGDALAIVKGCNEKS